MDVPAGLPAKPDATPRSIVSPFVPSPWRVTAVCPIQLRLVKPPQDCSFSSFTQKPQADNHSNNIPILKAVQQVLLAPTVEQKSTRAHMSIICGSSRLSAKDAKDAKDAKSPTVVFLPKAKSGTSHCSATGKPQVYLFCFTVKYCLACRSRLSGAKRTVSGFALHPASSLSLLRIPVNRLTLTPHPPPAAIVLTEFIIGKSVCCSRSPKTVSKSARWLDISDVRDFFEEMSERE
ncbi:hypothetical protein L211DRAFT_852416 [Terfezia boudieri ATCC MYA-4762]|uniref:Uncharacterized protein n=1 Tax=Terfezia boudieri ATCC MYA-4762 TaxID=1051890 RepID=A0A3N4LBN5_9PEZI|nr:hypothetical protein L211DRAFT_852416 [Terfezia boudieri ATCC MYA-4762]